MLSLQNNCINYIIEHNIDYSVWFTPWPLLELLEKNKIIKECGNIVNNIIINIDYDSWVNGLNNQINWKKHYYLNAKCFEQHLRKNVHNCGCPYSALSLYYLSQENDFNSWYNDLTAKQLGKRNQYGKKYGHVTKLIKLHQTWHETNYIDNKIL